MAKCKLCGSIYSFNGNGCPMCDESINPIQSYHSRSMEIQKIGKIVDAHKHTIHLGVELEVDCFPTEQSKYAAARDIFRAMNKKTKQYIKLERDGSLNNGFEIISQPIQLGSHLNSVNWKEMMEIVTRHGGGSHNSGNCGLHIHVERYSENFARNLWYLVNQIYKDDILIFSRRQRNRLNYCKFDTAPTYEQRDRSRYVALNTFTSTGCTVEFRLFRGTTKYETFIETLRLCERLCWLALDNEDVRTAKLPKFDSMLSKYGKEYMKQRRSVACLD